MHIGWSRIWKVLLGCACAVGSVVLLGLYINYHYRLRIKAVVMHKFIHLITAVCKYCSAVFYEFIAVELCIVHKQLHYH